MKTLLLVDGNAMMHRAYHALPPFKTKNGILTNVVYGFFSMLQKAIVDFKPTNITICFDTPEQTFRNKLFKKYQAQRPSVDDEFIEQIPNVKKALDVSGILRIEKEGYEADDLIGTVAKQAQNKHMRVLILTGDRDMMQLVNDSVFVVTPQKGLSDMCVVGKNEVLEKFNVPPEKIPDLKALMGDPSDNYSGAKGIGPKTAAKLLQKRESIEHLYEHLDELDEKTRNLLIEHKEHVLLSKKLATIMTDVPMDLPMDTTHFAAFNPKLKEFLLTLEMRSLAKRLFVEKKPPVKKTVEKKHEPQMNLF